MHVAHVFARLPRVKELTFTMHSLHSIKRKCFHQNKSRCRHSPLYYLCITLAQCGNRSLGLLFVRGGSHSCAPYGCPYLSSVWYVDPLCRVSSASEFTRSPWMSYLVAVLFPLETVVCAKNASRRRHPQCVSSVFLATLPSWQGVTVLVGNSSLHVTQWRSIPV